MSAAAQKTFQSARRQRGTNNSCCSNQIIMVGAASSILLCLLLLHRQSGSQASSPAAAVVAGSSSGLTLSLAGQREDIQGTEVVWQLPALQGSQPAKGILLAFHGCSHSAIDWWPRGTGCPTCIGLPEEVLITRTALSRGYAVVAISSRDRSHSRCWSFPHQPHAQTVDTLSVVAVVTALQQRPAFKNLPLYALGASSGGAFVLMLTPHLPLSAVCSQIMALPSMLYTPFLEAAAAGGSAGQQERPSKQGWHEPPVMFVHMTRDNRTAEKVQESVQLRRGQGLPTLVVPVEPQPVTAKLLARVPELAGETGHKLVQLFKQHGIIDAASGLLLANPRQSQWHGVLKDSGVPELVNLNLTPDESGLPELLNVAYAQHEIIADTTSQMLDWFEQQPVVAGN